MHVKNPSAASLSASVQSPRDFLSGWFHLGVGVGWVESDDDYLFARTPKCTHNECDDKSHIKIAFKSMN